MRTIRFRGQNKHGVWHYGYLWGAMMDESFYIKEEIEDTHGADFEVKKETIGQFTGLLDKNGKEIYEGDIVIADDNGECFPEELNEKTDEYEPSGKYIIKWEEEGAGFSLNPVDGSELQLEWSPFYGYATFEVIGNIYENKDLLKRLNSGG